MSARASAGWVGAGGQPLPCRRGAACRPGALGETEAPRSTAPSAGPAAPPQYPAAAPLAKGARAPGPAWVRMRVWALLLGDRGLRLRAVGIARGLSWAAPGSEVQEALTGPPYAGGNGPSKFGALGSPPWPRAGPKYRLLVGGVAPGPAACSPVGWEETLPSLNSACCLHVAGGDEADYPGTLLSGQ